LEAEEKIVDMMACSKDSTLLLKNLVFFINRMPIYVRALMLGCT
jgi:hypothetical protein